MLHDEIEREYQSKFRYVVLGSPMVLCIIHRKCWKVIHYWCTYCGVRIGACVWPKILFGMSNLTFLFVKDDKGFAMHSWLNWCVVHLQNGVSGFEHIITVWALRSFPTRFFKLVQRSIKICMIRLQCISQSCEPDDSRQTSWKDCQTMQFCYGRLSVLKRLHPCWVANERRRPHLILQIRVQFHFLKKISLKIRFGVIISFSHIPRESDAKNLVSP